VENNHLPYIILELGDTITCFIYGKVNIARIVWKERHYYSDFTHTSTLEFSITTILLQTIFNCDNYICTVLKIEYGTSHVRFLCCRRQNSNCRRQRLEANDNSI